jgi:hypothetical protein
MIILEGFICFMLQISLYNLRDYQIYPTELPIYSFYDFLQENFRPSQLLEDKNSSLILLNKSFTLKILFALTYNELILGFKQRFC